MRVFLTLGISLLILFPTFLNAATNSKKLTQKSVIVLTSEKPLNTPRLYQGILLSKEDIKEMIKEQFTLYGISNQIPTALKVAECESSFSINANNGISFGIFQYTKPTWKQFGYGDIFNPQSQIIITSKIVKKEGWKRWDCWRMMQ